MTDQPRSAAAASSQTLLGKDVITRIWRRDTTVRNAQSDSDVGRAIANRLGWLDVPTGMRAELSRVEKLADEVRRDGIKIVYLLGMGGSSLCAEVMRSVYALAFVITGEDATNTPIPGAPYTFSELKRAQAVGDYQTLEAHKRRAVRLHLSRGVDAASKLGEVFAAALK